MKLKYWELFAGILFLFYLSSCSNKSKGSDDPPRPVKRPSVNSALSVEAYVVRPTVLNSSIDVAGSLLPFEETEIHPEVAGKVVMLSIKEGSVVRKGTVLARLFDGDLQAQLHKLDVQLEIAKINKAGIIFFIISVLIQYIFRLTFRSRFTLTKGRSKRAS